MVVTPVISPRKFFLLLFIISLITSPFQLLHCLLLSGIISRQMLEFLDPFSSFLILLFFLFLNCLPFYLVFWASFSTLPSNFSIGFLKFFYHIHFKEVFVFPWHLSYHIILFSCHGCSGFSRLAAHCRSSFTSVPLRPLTSLISLKCVRGSGRLRMPGSRLPD